MGVLSIFTKAPLPRSALLFKDSVDRLFGNRFAIDPRKVRVGPDAIHHGKSKSFVR
jgi:hypothetical protein